MCLRCVFGPDSHGALAHRAHVLALLALVEHPEAIPAGAALRLGREILTLVGAEPADWRCETVAPTDSADASATKRRRQ